jgi:hypothetical protein
MGDFKKIMEGMKSEIAKIKENQKSKQPVF